jgi:3-dehydroquinate synthase
MKTSQLIFKNTFPSHVDLPGQPVLFYDRKLLGFSAAKQFIETFENRLALDAGEELKNINGLPGVLRQLAEMTQAKSKNTLVFVCLGGGTLGDFVGFLASIFKRGVRFVQIPSTWIAAVDSSHGGKNALNIGNHKNQIGTFYNPETIFLIRDLLFYQSASQLEDCMGEVTKIALIDGEALWKKVLAINRSPKNLWQLLPKLINAKYKIVKKDPLETKGIRYVLNLGHTIGHAIELSSQISHGKSVAYGLRAAIDYSVQLKLLSSAELKKIQKAQLPSSAELSALLKSVHNWQDLIMSDKKRSDASAINYVFIKKIGKPVVKKIPASQLIEFCQKTYL